MPGMSISSKRVLYGRRTFDFGDLLEGRMPLWGPRAQLAPALGKTATHDFGNLYHTRWALKISFSIPAVPQFVGGWRDNVLSTLGFRMRLVALTIHSIFSRVVVAQGRVESFVSVGYA